MPAVRGPYIRPLIEATRAQIEDYVKERGVEFVEDSSNESMKYLRNRLRLKLIPELEKEYNPLVKEALSSLSKSAGLDFSFIEDEAAGLFSGAKESAGDASARLFKRAASLSAPGIIYEGLSYGCSGALKGDTRELYSVHVDSFLGLINSTEPGASVDLPGSLRLRREYDRVVIERALESASESGYEVELNLSGETKLGNSSSSFSAEVLKESPDPKEASRDIAFFDFEVLDEMQGKLTVRTFRAGDRMTPLGMEGVKKVHDIFVDDKVVKSARSSVPILLIGEELLWVAGVRRSERAKLTSKTESTLKVQWHRGSVK